MIRFISAEYKLYYRKRHVLIQRAAMFMVQHKTLSDRKLKQFFVFSVYCCTIYYIIKQYKYDNKSH